MSSVRSVTVVSAAMGEGNWRCMEQVEGHDVADLEPGVAVDARTKADSVRSEASVRCMRGDAGGTYSLTLYEGL